MIEIEHEQDRRLIQVRVAGKLTEADYDAAIPELEQAIKNSGGDLSAVIMLDDLTGISLSALWKDLKFDMRHFNDFKRIAVVGDSRMEEWGAKASTIATGAEIEFFERDEFDRARDWARAA